MTLLDMVIICLAPLHFSVQAYFVTQTDKRQKPAKSCLLEITTTVYSKWRKLLGHIS